MNKSTRAVSEEEFKLVMDTVRNGFEYRGIKYRSNVRVATILAIQYNLGLRVGDVVSLRMDSFIKDGDRYRLDIVEQKTGKKRLFTVPNDIYTAIQGYAYDRGIARTAKIFPVSTKAVAKHLKAVCEYLNLEGVGTHSFRKGYATRIYNNSNHNIELVRTLLQHSNVVTTQRYITIGSKELEDAIQNNICLY